MVITSHAVGAVEVVVGPDGRVMCAQMKYETARSWSYRHMMETGEGSETIIETLRNGLLNEIAADPKVFEYELLKEEPILVETSVDTRNHDGTHLKVFFLIKTTKGELRSIEKQDGDEKLGPVRRSEIKGVIDITEGKTVPVHVRASKAALAALAADKEVFSRYQDIIMSYQPRLLTADERYAIDSYSRKW